MRYLLILLLMFAGTCQADQAGIIVASRGDVTVSGEVLDQGNPVNEGDTIITAPRSFAVVQFYDGGKLTVRPNSEVTITTYQDEDAQIDLVMGGLRIVTGVIAKNNPDNYNVKTPVALMGVRGTEFSIMLCGEDICEIEVE